MLQWKRQWLKNIALALGPRRNIEVLATFGLASLHENLSGFGKDVYRDAGAYDQRDAGGFIKLNALRLRVLAKRDQRAAKD